MITVISRERGGSARPVVVLALALTLGACSSGVGDYAESTPSRTAYGPGGVGALGPALARAAGDATPGTGGGSPGGGSSGGGSSAGGSGPSGQVSAAPAVPTVVRSVGTTERLQFVTPTRNIGCVLTWQFARCDIRDHVFEAPRKPESCDLDYGSGLVVEGGRASVVCSGDTVLGGDEILAYGTTARAGTYECVSDKAGVTCRNTVSAHGFTLSRDAYSLF